MKISNRTRRAVTAMMGVCAAVTLSAAFGQSSIDRPVRNEFEVATASLFGLTLAPDGLAKACADLHPQFTAKNISALEKWKRENAASLELIKSSTRKVLLSQAGGDAERAAQEENRYVLDSQRGIRARLENDSPDSAKKTCQYLPETLASGPFVLDKNPQLNVLRNAG